MLIKKNNSHGFFLGNICKVYSLPKSFSWLIAFFLRLVVHQLEMIEVFALVDEVLKSKVVEIIVGDEIVFVKLVYFVEERSHLFFQCGQFLVCEEMVGSREYLQPHMKLSYLDGTFPGFRSQVKTICDSCRYEKNGHDT